MNVLEELKASLEGRVDDWSPADRELALTVGMDLAALQAALLAGGDVDEVELDLAKAAAQNLASGAASTGVAVLTDFLVKITGIARAILLPV